MVHLVIKRAKMDDVIFEALNQEPSLSSDFEDFFKLRSDWAYLLSGIAKSCGPITVYQILFQFLSNALARKSQETDVEKLITIYQDLECLIFCCTQLVKHVDGAQLSQLKDVIVLVQ